MESIPFIGGHYQGRSPNVNAQETINFFPELDQEGGRAVMSLAGSPGLVERGVLAAGGGDGRCLKVVGNFMYGVCGNRAYRISKDHIITKLGGTLLTSSGPVWIEDNGVYLMLVDGLNGWYMGVTQSTIRKITDPDFPTPSCLSYQDGYFLVGKKDTGQFYQSELNDPRAWDALKFGTAEGRPDPILMVLMDHRELWLYGKDSTEVWYNAGGGEFAFMRVSGGFNEWGIGALRSPAKLDNGNIWLTNNYQVVRALDYTPKIVSTRQMEYLISQYGVKDDAIGFSCIFEGHAWYFLTFPAQNVTWVYDASTNLWHQRLSFMETGGTDQGRFRGAAYAYFNDKHYVLDHISGKLYEMRSDVYADDGEPLRAVRTGQVIENQGKWGYIERIEADVEMGVGLVTGQGSDPKVMMQISRDGGHTFGVERWGTLGKIGEYGKQAYWNKCGRGKLIVPRIIITDPVKRHIAGLRMNVRWE